MVEDRLYRGRCPHAAWWVLAATEVDSWATACAEGCIVLLTTTEPRATENGSGGIAR